jgi:hypothetical protein
MFPYSNIHKDTSKFPDGKTHSQIDYVLIDMRKHSSVLDHSGQEILVSGIMLRSQRGLQLWKIWTLRWKLIVLEKLLKRIKKTLAKDSKGYYELRKHKPWYDKGCSKLLDERTQAKLQWLQDPCEIKGII